MLTQTEGEAMCWSTGPGCIQRISGASLSAALGRPRDPGSEASFHGTYSEPMVLTDAEGERVTGLTILRAGRGSFVRLMKMPTSGVGRVGYPVAGAFASRVEIELLRMLP